MNPLPQRKKTPEEIAKLRESLGVPASPDLAAARETPPAPQPTPRSYAPRLESTPSVEAPPHESSREHSDPVPQLQVAPDLGTPVAILQPLDPPPPEVVPLAAPPEARAIRSLKRSERIPDPAAEPKPKPVPVERKLAVHRHSEAELAEIRRRDALAVISQGGFELPSAAHPALVAIGYILAIGGAAAPLLLDGLSRLTGSYALSTAFSSGYHLLTAGALAALPCAAFIFLRKSLSQHHAAFIAIIGFFALVFAVLHYFPQLRYAT